MTVRLDARGIGLEADAAIDAPRWIGGFGDDDPVIAAVLGGPARRDTEQVGGEAATPVRCVGTDALIPRSRSAPHDAQISREDAVGERSEERAATSRSDNARSVSMLARTKGSWDAGAYAPVRSFSAIASATACSQSSPAMRRTA